MLLTAGKIRAAGDWMLFGVMAALLLCAAAVPVISSKLNSLWSSEFAFRVNAAEPACVRSGLCFSFEGNRLERTASGDSIRLNIDNADNVFELARELDEGHLKVIVPAAESLGQTLTIQPKYNLYFNFNEVLRRVPASLELGERFPLRLTLIFKQGESTSEERTLEITKNKVEPLVSFLIATGRP